MLCQSRITLGSLGLSWHLTTWWEDRRYQEAHGSGSSHCETLKMPPQDSLSNAWQQFAF